MPLTLVPLLGRGIGASVTMALCLAGCASDGEDQGMLLQVLVDSEEDVGSVDYSVDCGTEELLSDVFDTIDSSLPSAFEAFVELPTGVCDVFLSAFGEDGSLLCSATVPLVVAPGTIDEPTIVLPCRGPAVVNNFNLEIENLTVNVCVVAVIGARNIGDGEAIEDTSAGDVELEVTTIGMCSEGAAPEVFLDASFVCEEVDCDDGNACTFDICIDGSACSHPAMIDGVSCGASGTCQAGACVPSI